MHALETLLGLDELYFKMNPGIILYQHVSNLGEELQKGKGGRIWCFKEIVEDRTFKNEEVQERIRSRADDSGGDGMPANAVSTKSETERKVLHLQVVTGGGRYHLDR